MPVRPSTPLRAPATRRTALGGLLLGIGALAACDADLSGGGRDGSGPASAGDPDHALVASVLADLVAATDLGSATAAAHPRLHETLAPLRALHEAHLEALGGRPSTAPATSGAGGGRPTAAAPTLESLRSRELRLQRRLVAAAVRAESGALARLLASMSAGETQQLAVLPGPVAR